MISLLELVFPKKELAMKEKILSKEYTLQDAIKDNELTLYSEIIVRYWQDKVWHGFSVDENQGLIRNLVKQLLPLTLGKLKKYHPGNVTVYRGTKDSRCKDKNFQYNDNKPRSWAKEELQASGFGNCILKKKITNKIPALDVTKVLGYSEDEVIT